LSALGSSKGKYVESSKLHKTFSSQLEKKLCLPKCEKQIGKKKKQTKTLAKIDTKRSKKLFCLFGEN
jgi:hypothetical protein